MTAAPYSGISTYCYANSLHMSLRGAGAASLPDVGFIECLTTMPFGKLYLRLPAGGLLFFSPAAVSPESGLDRALAAMGWECRRWTGGSEVALAMLKEELTTGPCLVGPLEMGLLTHNPRMPARAIGADHYVVVLATKTDRLLLHDPGGFPFATIPEVDFLTAWAVDSIPYKPGPCTLRSRFKQLRVVTRAEMIAATLPLIWGNLLDPGDNRLALGGEQAVLAGAGELRSGAGRSLQEHLVYFALPLGARRLLDGAHFLDEAGEPDMAANLAGQARLIGATLHDAATGNWEAVAAVMTEVATAEAALIKLAARRGAVRPPPSPACG